MMFENTPVPIRLRAVASCWEIKCFHEQPLTHKIAKRQWSSLTLTGQILFKANLLPVKIVFLIFKCLFTGEIFSVKTLIFKNHLIRWIPSAHDICFTRKLYTWFFIRGRCVPCVRGDGVYQKGVDFCMEQLDKGEWVQVFAEGKLCFWT